MLLSGSTARAQCDVDLVTTVFDCQMTNYCEGLSTANPLAGTAPFTYLWSNGDTSATADSLCKDSTYVVTMTDGTGCIARDTVTMTLPATYFVSHTVTNTSCPTCCDGTDTVIATLNNPDCAPLLYAWYPYPYSTSNINSTLCAGTYTVVVVSSCYCGGIAWTSGPPYCGTSYGTSTIGINNPNGIAETGTTDALITREGNRLHIASEKPINRAEIFDLQGRLLFVKAEAGTSMEINLADFTATTVLLSITTGDKRNTQVFIREN